MPTSECRGEAPSVTSRDLARYLDCLWSFSCSVSDLTPTATTAVGPSDPFYQRSEPKENLDEYIILVAKRARFSRATVVVAFVLLGRYTRAVSRSPHSKNVHRLFVVCLLLAAKLHCDHPTLNSEFAKFANIEVSEVNAGEICVASAIGFSLYVTAADYGRVVDALNAAAVKTLRGDITVAMAAVLGVAPPTREPSLSAEAWASSQSSNAFLPMPLVVDETSAAASESLTSFPDSPWSGNTTQSSFGSSSEHPHASGGGSRAARLIREGSGEQHPPPVVSPSSSSASELPLLCFAPLPFETPLFFGGIPVRPMAPPDTPPRSARRPQSTGATTTISPTHAMQLPRAHVVPTPRVGRVYTALPTTLLPAPPPPPPPPPYPGE